MASNSDSSDQDPFWRRKSLSEMTDSEWESLCDGCGRCCLNKLEEEESADKTYYTDVGCRLLDGHSCRCSDYQRRLDLVEDCVRLTPESLKTIKWRVAGTPFQRKVWTALPKIPTGTTMSYGALAAKLNAPNAMRAVGHANGSNPISVVVPCHRLIGANGTLVKYGGGLERKRWLLEHEGVALRA